MNKAKDFSQSFRFRLKIKPSNHAKFKSTFKVISFEKCFRGPKKCPFCRPFPNVSQTSSPLYLVKSTMAAALEILGF